jgi:hypothetical protein
VAGRQRFRDEVRLVSRVQLVAKIFDVALHGPWRDTELLRTFF